MFREQLMTALKSAVGNYNAGMSDIDAVVKAAQAADFNPDQAQRLVETYNTTKTISLFKTAADRTVTFSTADPEKVMSTLFDGKSLAQAKAAGAKEEGKPYSYDYSEYDRPESGLDKAAADDNYGIEISPLGLPTMDSLARAAYHAIDEASAAADKCASDAGMARCLYQDCLAKIARELTYDLGDPDKTEQALTYVKVSFPAQADALIGDLMARMPTSHIDKKAADVRVSGFGMEYPAIDRMLADAAEMQLGIAELMACEASFRKTAGEWKDEFEKIAGLAPQEPSAADKEVSGLFAPGFREKLAKATYESVSTWDQLAGTDPAKATKVKGETGSMVGEIFDLGVKGIGTGTGTELEKMVPKVITGPTVRDEDKSKKRLRNFQRQLMLEDLLSTDPILQGVTPNNALRAYEALVRIAPEFSLNKEVVRSILRTATNAEALSPYDAKQMAEIENIMRKTVAAQNPSAQVRVNV